MQLLSSLLKLQLHNKSVFDEVTLWCSYCVSFYNGKIVAELGNTKKNVEWKPCIMVVKKHYVKNNMNSKLFQHDDDVWQWIGPQNDTSFYKNCIQSSCYKNFFFVILFVFEMTIHYCVLSEYSSQKNKLFMICKIFRSAERE